MPILKELHKSLLEFFLADLMVVVVELARRNSCRI